MATKVFMTDSGAAYRAQELQVTPALLADDHVLATLLRGHLEEFGAVVVRVVLPDQTDADT